MIVRPARPPAAPVRPLALAAAVGVLVAAGCAVGPDYKAPPALPVPASFKEAPGWKTAAPDEGAKRGPWWEVFQDPVLSDLEQQLDRENLSIVQAVDAYEEARQTVRSDRSGYLPTVSIAGSAERTRTPSYQSTGQAITSSNSGGTGGGTSTTTTTAAGASHGLTSNLFTGELEASWTPDLWGKLRRTVEADVGAAQASAADLALARLSMESTLAQDYVGLRITDDKLRLLEDAVKAYERTLKITSNKYAVGVAARSDIITAQAELDATRAQLIDTGIARAQFEHAIAVLVGKAPGEFAIARTPTIGLALPEIPPMLPSTLLERRPDIAAAERLAAAASARIGVQTAAYFPDLSLTGAGGFEGPSLDKLISAPYKFWTIGANATDAILDWGQRHDLVLQAKAAFDAAAANYKQTVLTAFQGVEDNLAGLRILKLEATVQDQAVKEAAQASQIALNEYNAGTVDFTTVVAAQVTELTDRETYLTLEQEQLDDSILLIQALGGGWTKSDLPHP
jgi:NodT family efflux transporter outer membrane factor (OMF) lipoprotein